MNFRFFGALLIIFSCGGFGLSIALHQIKESRILRELIRILDQMTSELQYSLTPLPDLIRHTANHASGTLKQVFLLLAEQLDRQILPDASSCMNDALQDAQLPFFHVQKMLLQMGQALGRFDLEGQLRDLAELKEQCQTELEMQHHNQTARLQSYRVLGFCTGIALTILLI